MDLLYGKEVCGKKLPWQGLELCPAGLLYQKAGNRSWRKNRPFFKQCGNHVQTSAQYPASLMQKTKVTEYDSSSYEEICEAEDLVEEDTGDLGNQQIGTFLEHWT